MADQLRPDSIEWAIAHIRRHGDTDLLPVPFEYEAIRHSWPRIRAHLEGIDLATYETRAPRRYLVPKQTFGFRVAVQLDPIDTLVYTALAYECAQAVENFRIPKDRRVACSYRFAANDRGDMFEKSNGWDDFKAASQAHAFSGAYEKIIVADIADFYNHIGHHRVRNALELAGVTAERATNIEHLLMNFTGGQSRGLPVGPSASVIFSEACLGDVDAFLMRKGYIHTRYVDDFRIFCKDEETAWKALHDLTEYLYTAHRLTLQSNKTQLLDVHEFSIRELQDPEALEDASREEKLEFLAEIVGIYGPSEEDIDSYTDQVVKDNILELFDECLEDEENPHLGLAKYLLRRGSDLRLGILRESVYKNFSALIPVMREVAQYLIATTSQKYASEIALRTFAGLDDSVHRELQFANEWACAIALNRMQPGCLPDVLTEIEESCGLLGVRWRAVVAKALNQTDWVRERKENWQAATPWDRRAIIWAATALSPDERNYWLKRAQGSPDILDSAMAEATLRVGNPVKIPLPPPANLPPLPVPQVIAIPPLPKPPVIPT
jgi:hypothetical protein